MPTVFASLRILSVTGGGVIILRDVFEGWGRSRTEGRVEMTVPVERRIEAVVGLIGVTGSECRAYQARTGI